jgi:hypothetical protein
MRKVQVGEGGEEKRGERKPRLTSSSGKVDREASSWARLRPM